MSTGDSWDAPTEPGLASVSRGSRGRSGDGPGDGEPTPPSSEELPTAAAGASTADGEGTSLVFGPTTGVPGHAGPYRLLRHIGRGGMGSVFLAERADGGFERRVAVKLVRHGMDSEEILARFRRERQILASLRHPNIAALLDAGVTADGRPYLVMEHVEGTPITEHCDEHRLTVTERLELFCHVCDVVGFAHRSLVVHRDLKPSNVFVDTEGQVKLLDFGIAKLLGEERGAGLTDLRGELVAVMTPEYASPEQVRGEPVTTAVDVYQLGLLLHELLTGRRAQHLADGNRELEQVVCERVPPRPSVAVAQRGQARRRDGVLEEVVPADIAVARRSTPERLRRRLHGDLDAIVGTALRKEPAHRYASVEALAADVRRHCRQQPVLARRPAVRYQAAKFIRRHRGAALAAAAVIALLAGAASFYTVRIQTERDRARLEAVKASQSAALLERLFETWNPLGSDRQMLRPQDLLRLAANAAEHDVTGSADERAAMLSLLGGLHTQLADYDAAERLLGRALAIQEAAPAGSRLDLAATLGRRSRLLLHTGHLAAAEQTARRAVDLYRRELGPAAIETLRAQADLATAFYWRERFTEAEAELREILARLPAGSEPSPLLLRVERDLGFMLYHQGKIDESVPLLEAALARSRAAFGPLHATSLVAARQLGWAYCDQGRLAAAEKLLAEALRGSITLYGEDHEETDWARHGYAMLAVRQNRYAEAEALARRIVRAGGRQPDSTWPASRLYLLGAIRLDRGDPVEAERLLRQALAMYRDAYPEGHQDERDVLNRLAWVVVARGGSEGPALYREALATHRERFTWLPHFISDAPHFLAAAAAALGERDVAEAVYRESVALYRGKLAPGHPHMASALTGLGETLLASGRPAEAEPYLREAVEEWRLGGGAGTELVEAERALAGCRTELTERQPPGTPARR